METALNENGRVDVNPGSQSESNERTVAVQAREHPSGPGVTGPTESVSERSTSPSSSRRAEPHAPDTTATRRGVKNSKDGKHQDCWETESAA